jgi:hypothetical protein
VLGAPLLLVSDRYREVRDAVQVIAGAVQGIDHPQELAVARLPALLAQEGMVRVEAPDFPYNLSFAGAVHLAHVVVPRLALHRDGVHVLQLAAHDGGGGVGGLDGDIENGCDMADGPEKAAQDTRSGPAMAADVVNSAADEAARRLARIRIVLINTTTRATSAPARAMKVMGLSALHLVTPKSFPTPRRPPAPGRRRPAAAGAGARQPGQRTAGLPPGAGHQRTLRSLRCR